MVFERIAMFMDTALGLVQVATMTLDHTIYSVDMCELTR